MDHVDELKQAKLIRLKQVFTAKADLMHVTLLETDAQGGRRSRAVRYGQIRYALISGVKNKYTIQD